MADQTLRDNSSNLAKSLTRYLEIAEYLNKNPNQTKDGWNYQRIETFLRFIILNFGVKPADFDPEKANLQEVVNFLHSHPEIYTLTEEHLESIVPAPLLLEQLIKDWEEAKTKFQQERAVKKLTGKVETIVLISKYQHTIEERLNQAFSPSLTEAIVKELPMDPQLSLALEKTEDLQEIQKEAVVQKLAEEVQITISTAIANLKISSQEEKNLPKVKVTSSDLPMLVSELDKPSTQRQKLENWLKTAFSSDESKIITEILVPSVIAKIDPGRTNEAEIEEAVLVSLAENAQALDLFIPPEKISKIISAFIPEDKEELKVWQTARPVLPITFTEPLEVTVMPSRWLRITGSSLQRSSPTSSLQVKDEKGKSFIAQLRQRIFTEGIDKSNALQLRSMVLENWALYLTAQKITWEDLEYTIDRLIKSGEDANSFRIKELKEIREALIQFQNKLPPPLREKIKEQSEELGKRGSSLVTTPSSKSPFVLRKEAFNSEFNLKTRLQSFLGKLLGKKQVILDIGPKVVINKASFLVYQITEGSRKIFFQTGVGQNIGSWLKISTNRSLQGLWNLTQAGGKQIIGQGTKTLFGTVFKVAGSTIGTIATGGLGKILTLGSGLLKRGFLGPTSVIGIIGSLLGGISGGNPESDNKTIKEILLAAVAIIPTLVLVFYIMDTTKQTAFVQNTQITPYINLDPFMVVKTVSPAKIENSSLPTTFSYTVKITAKDKKLTNIKLTENFTLLKEGSINSISPFVNPPLPTSIAEILPEGTNTITYQINLPADFNDSLVLNTFSVEANIEGTQNPAIVKASASIVIGNATSCFTFEGPWPETEVSGFLTAISQVLSSSKYAMALCQSPAQPIILVRELANYDYCEVINNKIHITDRCTGSEQVNLYSLIHETGHVYSHRNNVTYIQFEQNFYNSLKQPVDEKPLCSYPLLEEIPDDLVPGEDFAETIAVYLMNKYYPSYIYHNCVDQRITLSTDYPKHNNFIKDLF